MNSMLIFEVQSHSSLKKNYTDMMSWSKPHIHIKHDLLQLKIQYKASLVGSTSHPMKKRHLQVIHCLLPFLMFLGEKTSNHITSS